MARSCRLKCVRWWRHLSPALSHKLTRSAPFLTSCKLKRSAWCSPPPPPCSNTMNHPVQTWDGLYSSIGLPSTNDPEQPFAIIITTFSTCHPDRTIATEQYYIHIVLHTHFSAITIQHFSEVMRRLTAVMPREIVNFLSIEVMQSANLMNRLTIRTPPKMQEVATNPDDSKLRHWPPPRIHVGCEVYCAASFVKLLELYLIRTYYP